MLVTNALGSARGFLLQLLGLHSLCGRILPLQGTHILLSCRSTGHGLTPRTALTAAERVDERLGICVVRVGSIRSANLAFDDLVEMSGKRVTSRIDVDRGGESLDLYGFLYPPLDPVLLAVENGDILFAKVMVVLSCMLIVEAWQICICQVR